ncbi:MAG: hypothetical protein NT164_03190 [Verrucomicrobiae bacterium]|nr:hypothetical protein [Verrucomicrobiae bacterium]
MNTMSFEDAVREVRDKFRPVDLNQTTDAHPKATEADVQKAIGEIDQVSKNPADKIRIATQLKDDANNKFLKVGTSAEGGHLTGLPLASAKREQQYLVDVYAAVLSQLSPK